MIMIKDIIKRKLLLFTLVFRAKLFLLNKPMGKHHTRYIANVCLSINRLTMGVSKEAVPGGCSHFLTEASILRATKQ